MMPGSSARAFDARADGYDQGFSDTPLGRCLRSLVWRRFDACFAGRKSLLELGCGTGEDAIHFAQLGHRVLATDASAAMIRVARRKAEQAGVAARVRFLCMPMESLDLGSERFDGVYSNFGAVNCVADIPALARRLAARLEPGAPLAFVAMGRYVPWEWAWFLLRGDRARAFRRLAADGVDWHGLRVRYPTPATLAKALAPAFRVRRRSSLGFALPPSYAASWLNSAPRTLAFLSAVERSTGRITAALADHFILEAVLDGAAQRDPHGL